MILKKNNIPLSYWLYFFYFLFVFVIMDPVKEERKKKVTILKLKYLQIQEVCIKENYRSGILILVKNNSNNTRCIQN